MKVLVPFLRPYRGSMAVALTLMLLEVAVELWQPLLLAKLIDEGIVRRDYGVIALWGGIMIAAALAWQDKYCYCASSEYNPPSRSDPRARSRTDG